MATLKRKGELTSDMQACLLIVLILSSLFQTNAADVKSGNAALTHRKLATVSQIQSCLSPAGATVLYPGSSAYETSRARVWNSKNLYKPAAIVQATTIAHVQNAIQCAVQLKIGISPRCGGHSYEDYGLGGRDNVLVVDVAGFKQFSYDSTAKVATVGAGYALGPLKLLLWNTAKVTVPSGVCPSVGVSGHALGGGWGFLARKYGITSDNIVEIQMVSATGSLVTTNANQNPNLFKALRGAGANSFGIVTQFKFKVADVSQPMTYFEYTFPKANQFDAIKAYQIWGVNAAPEVSASLYQDPGGGNRFYGTYLGPQSGLQAQVQTFLNNIVPPSVTPNIVQTDFIHIALQNAGFKFTDDPSKLNLNGYTYESRKFKSKAVLVRGSGMSDTGIRAYVNRLQSGSTSSYFIFDLFGKNSHTNKQPFATGDGWVHRDSLYNIQMFGYWQNNPSTAATVTSFIEGIYSIARSYSGSSEAYQNYIDVEEPLSAYYGSTTNLNALKATKRGWDAGNVFNYNQSIPVN